MTFPVGFFVIMMKFNLSKQRIMEAKHEECQKALHMAFGITKIVLKAAAVAAAFCLVKEVHKVHKAIEYYKEEK